MNMSDITSNSPRLNRAMVPYNRGDLIKDYKGRPGYSKWKGYISKIAQQLGYKFLDFLGAEDSIESSKKKTLKPNLFNKKCLFNRNMYFLII